MHTELRDVLECYKKFGLLTNTRPGILCRNKAIERLKFLQEELSEFEHGINNDDLAEQADALIDLVYVALGTAIMMGLPWSALWMDVHRANMEKVKGKGKRGNHDLVKPDDWKGPNTKRILETFDRVGKMNKEVFKNDD